MRNEGCCIVKHDLCHTRLYGIWKAMKKRVAKSKYYKDVEICDDWKNDFLSFYNWAMSNGYSDRLTLDRIDNDGNYCQENCRWANKKVQANNRRNNVYLTAFGKTQTLQQWADETGINRNNITRRIRNFNWPIEKALTVPTRKLERRQQ